jgi:hypothetical protein
MVGDDAGFNLYGKREGNDGFVGFWAKVSGGVGCVGDAVGSSGGVGADGVRLRAEALSLYRSLADAK